MTPFSRWINEVYTSAVSSDHAIICAAVMFVTELALGVCQWIGRDETVIHSLRAEWLLVADEVKSNLRPK